MRRRGVLLLAMGLLLGPAPGCQDGSSAAVHSSAAVAEDVDPIVDVESARVRRGAIVQRITAPGNLVARREALIGPEVRGLLQQILVDEGDRVEAGDPLFQIDPEPYQLALRRAEAMLDRVRAERRQLESDLARGQALGRQKVLSEQETDRIASGLEASRAQEREANEAVSLARLELERTLVRAPFAGAVTRRLADEGTTALVQPQTIVLVLQEVDRLEAIATLAEIHFAAIAPGDVALLLVEGLPLPIQTEVAAVGAAIDPASRTFRVRMDVPNPDNRLKAGLFARVEILPKAKSDVLLVPREALRSLDGSSQVLVVRDDRAELRTIETGLISESSVEVLAGLRADEQVLIGDSARNLGSGMRVRVTEQAPAP